MSVGGNESMDPLSRPELKEALRELSRELRLMGVKAHLYIVGGAAISLAFDARRVTMDIDALILDGHGPVTDAARRIGRRRGWPTSWLNEQAVSAMPHEKDRRARTVYGDEGLVVTSASAEYLLAMKVRAGRAADMTDISFLVRHLGLRSAKEVFDLHDRVFPKRPLSERAFKNVRQHLAGFWPTDRSLCDRNTGGGVPEDPVRATR